MIIRFEGVPCMDREYFNKLLAGARSFGVWVQVSPYLQHCLPITREQAVYLADYVFKDHPDHVIWGFRSSDDGRLELGITSQWEAQRDKTKPPYSLPSQG